MANLMQILEPYLDDLWLERRHDMDQLIEIINEKTKGDNGHHEDYAQFLAFLKLECSGRLFKNDKQWSELLNLIQISKLTNHKTLRLGQLLKNKQQIELNSAKIRELNDGARRIAAVDNLLSDLEKAIDNCQIDISCIVKSDKTDPDSSSLIEQISTSLRYVQDFCRVPLGALQAELRTSSLMGTQNNEDNKSKGISSSFSSEDNLDQYKQKLIKFKSTIELFEYFLDQLGKFQDIIHQLKPLLIASSETNKKSGNTNQEAQSVSGNSINNSLNECKSTYARVLLFNKQILDSLVALSKQQTTSKMMSQTRQSKSVLQSSAKKPDSLLLSRLVAPNVGVKPTSIASIIKPEVFSKGLKENLESALECKAKLDKIFNLLRLEFGRLYFVNDVELLMIISLDTRLVSSQTNETRQLLSKLYNNSIAAFLLEEEDKSKIIGVENPFGEKILFFDHEKEPVLLHKKVNIYSLEIIRILNACMQKLRKSLRKLLLASNNDLASEINFNLPVQLMIISEHLKFCENVEKNLKANLNFSEIELFYERRMSDLNARLRNNDKDMINQIDYYKHSACISQTIQFLSIISELKMADKRNSINWIWLKQLRYKLNLEEETCDCLILDMKFAYNFDYLPFQVTNDDPSHTKMGYKRLIATKMTDRCLLVASHALNYLRLGANPFGPAGSGKTETIKSLGHALGHLVIVHNCDESNEGKSLDRLIWGLAHTGLWGCFDEFNRLSESTLSSVSSTLELVQTSLRRNLKTVEIPDKDKQIMSLDSSAAFFITLNPIDTSGRYGGRRRLPANLRSLFQPISMIQIPMLTIVSESLRIVIASSASANNNQITSEKFWNASEKLVELFKLMRQEPLSRTNCEFDLRLVVAILNRYQIMTRQKNQEASMEHQLAKAIHCEVLPRLGSEEIALNFAWKLINMFQLRHQDGLSAMSSSQINFESVSDQRQQQLCRHLYSQLETRNGVILLGSSKTGKTATWHQLISILNDQGRREKIGFLGLNPRCCKREQLFGNQDRETMIGDNNAKWIDGLFTHCTRIALSKLRSSSDMTQFWIILDGPLDPDWVETLNSVLDDNQVLTLSSGERLDFALPSANKSIKLIFETDDISFASPATISRLGLVFHGNQQKQLAMEHVNRSVFNSIIKNKEIMKNLSRALVLVGSEHETRNLLEGHDHIKYNCHEHSIAQDLALLVDGVASNASKLIYLANFDTIQAEDKWKVKSFEEMLRFIIEYGNLYNPSKGPWNIQANEFKFVLHCETFDRINKRLASLCDVYTIIDNHTDSPKSLVKPNELSRAFEDNAIISIYRNGHSTPKLINYIANDESARVEMFNNGRNIRLNLEKLMEKLSSTNVRAAEKDDSRANTSKRLYILTDLHFELMQQNQKNQLLSVLNIFATKQGSINIQFVYLSAHLDKFWQSIGCTIKLVDYEGSNGADFSTGDLAIKLANQKSHLKEKKLALLASKLDEISEKILINSSDFFNQELINEEFYFVLGNLIERFESNLVVQRVNLESGLQRLTRFEENIENVRDLCKSRVSELAKKRVEMDQVVKSLDEKVNSSELIKSQLRNMGQKQEAKSLEISERQSKIELELKHVKPLLDNSKRDIEQHLRPEALNEIRTLRSPPKTIKDILDGVFLLMGKTRDLSWSEAKSLLARASLRGEITSLDLRKIMTQQMVARLTQMMQDPSKKDSFERSKAERASKAILPLLNWLLAVYEFGKVQANMLPLNKELKQLEMEQSEIGDSIGKSRGEIDSLEKTISIDKEKLQQLRAEYTAMETESNNLNDKIEHALKALQDCAVQLNQWRDNLSHIREMDSRNDPMRYALFGSTLALATGNLDKFALNNILGLGKDNCSIKLNNFLSNETTKIVKRIDIDEGKLNELLAMRILIEGSHLIPFLDLNQAGDDICNDEFEQVHEIVSLIQQFYSHKNATDFQVISCSQLSDWSNLLEIAMRLNKFILVHLVEAEDSNNITLDIMSIITEYKLKNPRLEVILVGNSQRQSALVSLGPVKCINLLSYRGNNDNNQQSLMDVKDKLMSKFMARFDTNLSESVAKLELELKEKRRDRANLESNLISKLSNQQEKKRQTSREPGTLELDEPLIAMLSELQVKSKQFDADLLESQNKLNELNEKRNLFYEKLAREAAGFYVEKILPICKLNPSFYKMSLDSYVKLLIGNNKKSLAQLDYANVMQALDRSLAPADKSKARQIWQLQQSGATDLKSIIEEQLVGTNAQDDRILMIAVHDANKPSPQAYIDYLLVRKQQESAKTQKVVVYYFKLFATSNTEENRLMGDRLRNIINETPSTAGANSSKSGLVIVICIVNAHLAAKWINSRLLHELDYKHQAKLRVLCVLVAEIDSRMSSLFDFKLLDYANCLYWHDELSLSLFERFELYEKTLKTNPDEANRASKLILFHVICQELSKKAAWLDKSGYSFDYEQLARAWQTYEKQSSSGDTKNTEELFCNYVETVLYGARMNTPEDEAKLCKLAKRFLRASEADKQLVTFENLRRVHESDEKAYEQLVKTIST